MENNSENNLQENSTLHDEEIIEQTDESEIINDVDQVVDIEGQVDDDLDNESEDADNEGQVDDDLGNESLPEFNDGVVGFESGEEKHEEEEIPISAIEHKDSLDNNNQEEDVVIPQELSGENSTTFDNDDSVKIDENNVPPVNSIPRESINDDLDQNETALTDNTDNYVADNSSPQTIERKSSDKSKKLSKKLEKHESDSGSSNKESSLKTIEYQRKESDTDHKIETDDDDDDDQGIYDRLLLPRLRSPENINNNRRRKILGTGLQTKYHGIMPPVYVPLDKIGLLYGEEAPRIMPQDDNENIELIECSKMELNAKYEHNDKTSTAPAEIINAHVSYEPPNKNKPGHWNINIDGTGLQFIIDLTEKKQQKKKQQRKVKREIFSFWPKKHQKEITKRIRRHLIKLEKISEENHIKRIEDARNIQKVRNNKLKLKDIDSDEEEYVIREITKHFKRLELAREKQHYKKRKIASRPKTIKTANENLPNSNKKGVYDTDLTIRKKDAKNYYTNVSQYQNNYDLDVVAAMTKYT